MQPNSPPGFDKYQVSSFAGLNVHAAEEAGNTPPRAGNERGRNAALQRGQAFLILLSQKVAREARTDSCKGRDSDISRWGLIWISERQTTVNRDLRGMSRGL